MCNSVRWIKEDSSTSKYNLGSSDFLRTLYFEGKFKEYIKTDLVLKKSVIISWQLDCFLILKGTWYAMELSEVNIVQNKLYYLTSSQFLSYRYTMAL